MFGFVSHRSACEALRLLDGNEPRWPEQSRQLPHKEGLILSQRDFARWERQVDLAAHGIVSRPVDLLVFSKDQRRRGKRAHFHVWGGPVPAGSMVRLGEYLLVSGPELVIIQHAGYQLKSRPLVKRFTRDLHAERDAMAFAGLDPHDAAFDHPWHWERTVRIVRLAMLVCEFCGTYRLAVGEGTPRYRVAPLTSKERIGQVLSQLDGVFGERRVREALRLGFEGSASPMETALVMMLTLPVEWGGFGLPRPQMNHAVNVRGLPYVPVSLEQVTPDLLWEDRGQGHDVVLEYDSDEFHGVGDDVTAAARSRKAGEDAVRSNVLALKGFLCLRATTEAMRSVGGVELLARQVAFGLGEKLREPNKVEALRRRRLFAILTGREAEEAGKL